MNKVYIVIAIVFLVISCRIDKKANIAVNDLSRYVNPYIGSEAHGHVFVGANVPFGAVQLGPGNFNKGWDWCSGYHYSDSIVKGFSHMHLSGTGISDLGDILVMPATGKLITNIGNKKKPLSGYASLYSHENEEVKPGYYKIMLERYNIQVELTASERVGFHKYVFPASDKSRIIVNLGDGNGDRSVKTFIRKVNDNTITGYRFSKGWANDQRVFFAMQLSKPFDEFLIYNNDQRINSEEGEGKYLTGILSFKTERKETVMAKVGLSPVSEQNAIDNINNEIPEWNFDDIVKQANDKWNNELGKLKIKASTEVLSTFYTALYHTMFAPVLFNDYNRDYRGTDKVIYERASHENYSIFSLWDTYRAAHPLYTITQQERISDFINSMLAIYKQQEKLPVWHLLGCETNTMIGYSAVPVVVDAYLKGFKGYEIELAYEAVKKSAMTDEFGLNYLKKLGYIPADKELESVAKAMEYSIDDWCIAQMARELGKDEDYEYFLKRAGYYKKYFDTSINFPRGILSDGSWRTPFNPSVSKHREDDYCEGNAWQYIWLVPHDVEGLIDLFGSKDAFITKLDSLFIIDADLGKEASADISGLIGQYAHGNEPSHHITYLYTYAGQQWKTAEKVRYILNNLYSDKPDGLCGNEDCGQMSAWYIFSALGFYPVNPANGAYVFGSPIIDEAVIPSRNGKSFTIKAYNNSKDNIYIQSVKLNGTSYTKSYITHKDIQKGGLLEFWMDDKPNKTFGSKDEDLPRSIVY